MPLARLQINTLSGGVGRQAPTKRLTSEAENLDNCLVTLEKSVEKRPPLSMVASGASQCYLNVSNLTPLTTFAGSGGATNFAIDNLYFHWLDIDGFNRYCIIINRAGYTFDPEVENSFNFSATDLNLSNFITVYRIEPTEWVQEVVDNTGGDTGTGGFNRAVFEYLTLGNRSILRDYPVCAVTQPQAPATITETFGSTDYSIGMILWNKLMPLGFAPDRSQEETSYSHAAWGGSFASNRMIHSGDVVNYKRTQAPNTTSPILEDTITDLSGYWTNVRDDINFVIDSITLEEEEIGQSLESFSIVPQYPATEVYNDVRDFNGYRAWRMLEAYYDNPRLLGDSTTINWGKDDYYLSSPLPAEDRDGDTSYLGLGKVYATRSPYLNFPTGFYRATRYGTHPYFERVRAEGPNSVLDYRRFPLVIYKDIATDGKWRVKPMPITPRRSGNSVSNPGPTSVTRKEKIQSISIWKNRLWVATDNTLLASRTNDYFNFWINDISNIVETDPIDIQASVGAYTKLSYTLPFQNVLFVLSSGSMQFECRGGSNDVGMSPFNVELRPTSFVSTSRLVEPQRITNSLFFANAGKVYIYLTSDVFGGELSSSQEVSAHCRGYLPENISVITANSATSTLFMVNADATNEIYAFTYRASSEKVMQQAFYRWILSDEDDIKAMHAYEKDCYIVSKRNSNGLVAADKLVVYFTSLLSVPIATPMLDWLVKIPVVDMTYNSGPQTTTIKLPYYDPDASLAIKAPEWGVTAYTAYSLDSVDVDLTTGQTNVVVTGNLTAFPMYVGRSYEMVVELSQQVQRSLQEPTRVYDGVLNLKRMTTRHLNTGNYDIVIERNGRPASTTTFFPTDLNSIVDRTDELVVDIVGEYFTKILAYSEGCRMFIKSSYPTPCNISNIEIIGNWRTRNTSIE